MLHMQRIQALAMAVAQSFAFFSVVGVTHSRIAHGITGANVFVDHVLVDPIAVAAAWTGSLVLCSGRVALSRPSRVAAYIFGALVFVGVVFASVPPGYHLFASARSFALAQAVPAYVGLFVGGAIAVLARRGSMFANRDITGGSGPVGREQLWLVAALALQVLSYLVSRVALWMVDVLAGRPAVYLVSAELGTIVLPSIVYAGMSVEAVRRAFSDADRTELVWWNVMPPVLLGLTLLWLFGV